MGQIPREGNLTERDRQIRANCRAIQIKSGILQA